jgi:hypothetical protein
MKKTPPPDKPETRIEQYEPVRPTLLASVVFVLATMTLAWPVLTGQILFNSRNDQYTLGYAFRHFAEESLRSGNGIPHWSPYLQGGLPYIGAMHGDIFYPTTLLRLWLGTAEGITWSFIIALFLAGLFTFRFLRAWRLPFVACVIGGLAYMMCGSIAGYASPGHDGKLYVSAIFPMTLLLLTRGVRDGRSWAWGALAISVAAAALSPHPQLFQYMLLASGSFALWMALATHEGVGKLPTVVGMRRLGFALGAVVLGMLASAIQFYPLLKYMPYSPRAAGHSWEEATSYSFPIEETLNAYLPQFSGILDNYWGRNIIHFHSDYFGVVVLFLMGAAFGASRLKSFKWFWIGAAVVAMLWAYGGHTPLYHLILLIPGNSQFRAPSTMIYVTAFGVAVLAALGTERLLARQVAKKYAPAWAIGAGVFAVLLTVGGYRLLSGAALSAIGSMMDQYYNLSAKADANSTAAILGGWRSFLFVALAAAVVWAYYDGKFTAKIAGFALAALVLVDFWTIERAYWQFMPPASQTFASDPAIDSIKADIARTGPGRTLLFPAGNGLDRLDPYFRKRALMNHLLRTPEGEQGNELGAYRQMMQLDSGQVWLNPNFWRHENVRYMYTGLDEQSLAQMTAPMGLPPFTKLAGPVRNANGSMVFAYRMGMPNPYAWVTSQAVSAQPEQVLPTVLNPRFDPTTAAIVDTGSAIQGTPPASLTPSPNRATVKSYEPGKIAIDLALPAVANNVLVLSENYYNGWTATSAGTPLTVARVNYNLIGVALPAGTQHVELSYRDPGYDRGKAVTLIALAVAILLLVLGLVADRRRPAPVVATA